jgi:hypothetical protein
VIFDADPTIDPCGEIPMRIEFKRLLIANGPYNLRLRWILPEGWSVEGCKQEIRVPHLRPSCSKLPTTSQEISFTVRAPEKVDYQNRLLLEVTCFNHVLPSIIPITILG